MRGPRIGLGFSILIALLIALFAGAIGYLIGTSSQVVTTTAAAGATPVVVWGGGWGWGWFPFGFLFVIFFFWLIFAIIRRAAWGGRGHGYGYYGRGWYGSDPSAGKPNVPPYVDSVLQDWHRGAHGQPPSAQSPGSGGGSSTNPPNTLGGQGGSSGPTGSA
jgi:hypothetical protein